MARPFSLRDQEVSLSASIGIAVFPDAGTDAITLLKHADAAMYAAKESGPGRCAVYPQGLRHASYRSTNADREPAVLRQEC